MLLLFSLLSFFQIWLYERFWLLHPPTIPPSLYLPKHYRDPRPKCAETSFDEFTDIQWVVELWLISSMDNHNFKDNYVPSVRLRCCSYYSTCHIARQFGDRQGAPSDDGSFHTLAFTNRIFSRIHDSWLQWRVTKGIYFPQFLHPTSGYKKWLEANMKWVPIDEKAYKRSNKRKRTD